MLQDNSHRRDRKLAWVAPASIALALLVIVIGSVLYLNAHRSSAPPPAPAPVAEPPPAPPLQPRVEPVLTRKDLIEFAAQSAASFADEDAEKPAGKDALAGRQFAISLPFGCDGPRLGAGSAQAFYEFDPEERVVRLVARPGDWISLPMMQPLQAEGVEAVEGFWVRRPWRYTDACPQRRKTPAPAAPTPPATPTLGLAQLFGAEASRVARHAERPYVQVVKLTKDETLPLGQGYRLVIEGRISAFPGGRSVSCWSESPNHRPICVFAVALTRIAFAKADGESLAEWRE